MNSIGSLPPVSTLITTGLDESMLGDVLLFISPESSCQNTKVVSAFTHKTYYTITTDAGGFNTRIYRGNAKGSMIDGFFNHIATVSTANGHRVWESTEREEHKDQRTEVSEKVDEGSGSEDEFLEERNSTNEKESSQTRTDALGTKVKKQGDVFLIEYGKGASTTLRECVKLEKGS